MRTNIPMPQSEYQLKLPPPEQGALQSLLKYVSIFLRYKWLVLGITASVGFIALAFCAVTTMLPPDKNPLPNQYTANATILIQQNATGDLTANILSALSGSRESAAPMGFEYSALVLRMLQSRVILDQIAEEFDIAHRFKLDSDSKSQMRSLLLGKTHFQYARSTSTITISFRDTDPVFARDVVNRMVLLLNQWFTETWGTSAEKQKDLVEQKMVEVKGQIGTLEDQLKTLQKKYGYLNTQDMAASQAATLADLRSQLILKEIEIKNYSSFARQEDPHLQQLNAERQNIQDLINQVSQGSPGAGKAGTPQQDLPDAAQQYSNVAQELDVQRGIYSTLSRQYEVAKLAIEPLPVFHVLEMAEVPDHKSGPSRTSIIFMSTVIALFASLLLVLAINGIQKVRSNPELRRMLAPHHK